MKKIYLYSILVLAIIVSFIFDKNISIFFTSYRTSILNSIAIFIDLVSWYVLFSVILLFMILSVILQKINIQHLLVVIIKWIFLKKSENKNICLFLGRPGTDLKES